MGGEDKWILTRPSAPALAAASWPAALPSARLLHWRGRLNAAARQRRSPLREPEEPLANLWVARQSTVEPGHENRRIMEQEVADAHA